MSATTKRLIIGGMTCPHCQARVQQALLGVPGVARAQVSYDRGTADVTLDPEKATLAALRAAIERAIHGFDPRLSVHDFRMVRGRVNTNVIFDMVLPFSMEGRKQELRELVERKLREAGKPYHVVITFDMQAFNDLPGAARTAEKT